MDILNQLYNQKAAYLCNCLCRGDEEHVNFVFVLFLSYTHLTEEIVSLFGQPHENLVNLKQINEEYFMFIIDFVVIVTSVLHPSSDCKLCASPFK